MTKFEKAVKYEKVLKEVEKAREKIKTIYEELESAKKEMPTFDTTEKYSDEDYGIMLKVDWITTKLYSPSEACDTAIDGLKTMVDKAWFDFYAQEYEEEGEEDD